MLVFLKYLFIYLFGYTGSKLWHVGSSCLTKDRTWTPALGAWSLSHWTILEAWVYNRLSLSLNIQIALSIHKFIRRRRQLVPNDFWKEGPSLLDFPSQATCGSAFYPV